MSLTLSLPNERSRLLQDLEFLQMLGNIEFVSAIANRGFLANYLFINYLRYLRYLKYRDYAEWVTFPNCFPVLKLLLDDTVREAIIDDPDATKRILAEQFYCGWFSGEEYSVGAT